MVDVADAELDLSLAALLAGFALADEVQRRLADAGYPDARFAHGFVFQHLIPGPLAVSELSERLDMTAQGASKAVIELERLGYVQREPGEDRRVRRVALTDR